MRSFDYVTTSGKISRLESRWTSRAHWVHYLQVSPIHICVGGFPEPANNCRIRHVKCDETKPSCRKCSSTGRVCDGYSAKKSIPQPVKKTATRIVPVRAMSIGLTPDIGIKGTDKERLCFEFFYRFTGCKAAAIMDLQVTHQFILQACHFDRAVLSAVVALGYLGQRYMCDKRMIPGNARNKLIDDYAHLQYCRTLKCLRGLISGDPNRPTELTVISCYLLVVFEFLRGDYMTAMVHVRSGFNILRQGAGSLQSMTSLKQELFRVFSFGNIQAPPARQPSKADHHFDTRKRFSTLEEAAISLSFWVARLHHCQPLSRLYQRVEALELTPLSLAAPGEDLNIDTENSPTNMDALLAKMKKGINESTPSRAAVMKIDMILNFVLLTGAQEKIGESIYVTLEPQFREIVSLATSVVSPLDG